MNEAGKPTDPAVILETLPYHREIVEYLATRETELWKWFSSTAFLDEYAANTRLELLKSCYRFDPADHAELYALVEAVRERLGLAAPLTLYQSQSAQGMNASLCYVPGEAHLVLEGPIRATLSQDELRAIVAHELAHFLLWERKEVAMLVADQMLSAMAAHPRAEPSHVESARLFRLYLEVHCDRAALAISPDPLVAISALIKVQTGLTDVQAESYLKQSDEIFGQTEVKTEGLTHPESFIRARALKLWADRGDAAAPEIARMTEGPLDLGRLSLLGQQRLTDLTRRALLRFLEPTWLRTETLVAHSRLFFPALNPDERDSLDAGAMREELTGVADSVRNYLCYVLLDLATVDPQLEQAPLAAALTLADDLGIGEAFVTKVAEELDLSKRVLTRLRRDSAKIVSDAASARVPES
ncbi:MAG: M48 family metalloprotease [Polyangiaceae bacterium]|nr:M48 family metalloprotease [Polyangiaceae bacterium]